MSVHIGQRAKLTKDIYDDGEDHHPPGYLGLEGDIVEIREIRQRTADPEAEVSYVVAHPEVKEGGFVVQPEEIQLTEG